MRIIDLSQPVFDGSPNCPAHPRVKVEIIADHSRGDGWRMELLTLASHTGSHVDAPLHKLAGGNSLDDIPLERFAGSAVIADIRSIGANGQIDSTVLSGVLPKDISDKIVLLATGWGDKRAVNDEWNFHSPRLMPDGARWLVQRHIRAVGIDHWSIGGAHEADNALTHDILLSSGMWIVEDLHFPPQVFTLTAPVEFWSLPIHLKAHSGGFCRPVICLRDEK